MDELVFQKCGKSVVRLHLDGVFQGTGFVVHTKRNECLIMTCAHVVKSLKTDDKAVKAYFPGDNVAFECELLHADEVADLALLQSIPGARIFDSVTALQFLAEPVAFRQQTVLLAFYTLDDGVTPMIQPGTSQGKITAQPTDHIIAYSASSKRGTSGGAVICSSAGAKLQVAGVHSQTNMGNSYAVPVMTVRRFLWDWVTEWTDTKAPFDDSVPTEEMLENGARLEDQARKMAKEANGGVEEDKNKLV